MFAPYKARRLYLLIYFIVFTSASATFADVITLVQRDEISGKSEYSVGFSANSYRRITDEDFLMLTCKPDGTLFVDFHYGYRVSGIRLNPRDVVTVKFDDHEPIDMTLRSFLGERILDDVRKSSVMLIKVPHRTATFKFNLKGSSKALEPFKRQCGV